MFDLSSSGQHIPTALAKFLFPLLESTNFRFWPKAEVLRTQCNPARSNELRYFTPAVIAAISNVASVSESHR
jgi:hypothetical protein